MSPLRVAFVGGARGLWRVLRIDAVRGETLAPVDALDIVEGAGDVAPDAGWVLRGTTGHTRYVHRDEATALKAVQPSLGRPEATRAAFIPIQKSDAWWELPQDERRAIFEERSRHIAASLEYLPAIARRLHHGRELLEPFDFLTWFEYAPEHVNAFEDLVGSLRATEEWEYVVREVDLRLAR